MTESCDVAIIGAGPAQPADLLRIRLAQHNPLQPPNDLLDQRDALVERLNTLVGATVVTQSDGSVNVAIGNGQNLVVGDQAISLAASRTPRPINTAPVTRSNQCPMRAKPARTRSRLNNQATRQNHNPVAHARYNP